MDHAATVPNRTAPFFSRPNSKWQPANSYPHLTFESIFEKSVRLPAAPLSPRVRMITEPGVDVFNRHPVTLKHAQNRARVLFRRRGHIRDRLVENP